jgi:nitrile hydratase subunit beta
VFHEPWERRMFALMFATFAGGQYNVDEFRHGIERMDPAQYLTTSYYEHWLHTLEANLIERGVITKAELDARAAELAKEAS